MRKCFSVCLLTNKMRVRNRYVEEAEDCLEGKAATRQRLEIACPIDYSYIKVGGVQVVYQQFAAQVGMGRCIKKAFRIVVVYNGV